VLLVDSGEFAAMVEKKGVSAEVPVVVRDGCWPAYRSLALELLL
jgi:hypothetical protein